MALIFVYTDRRELRPFGVKVSIIEPGYFRTGLNDMQHMKNILKNIWKNLHPEIHSTYGETYFKKCKLFGFIKKMLSYDRSGATDKGFQ